MHFATSGPVAAFWKHRWSDAAHLVLAVGYDPNLDGMQQVLVIDPEESLTNDNVITRWIPYRNFFAIRQFIGGWAESSSFDLYGIVDSGKDGFEQ